MKALQRIVEVVREHLRGLSPSNRLLIGCLAVIILMALFIVALYTSNSSLVPLPLTLTNENRAAVVSFLDGRGIRWSEKGSQIVVPAEQRHVVLAGLTDQEIIAPEQIDFDALVQQESPFLSKAQNERRWLVATMNQLARTISRMHGVRRAAVVIDEPTRSGGIGRAHIPPSAAVTVHMRKGALGQEQVNAIAAMVAGAHAELKMTDVEVIDANAGRHHRASDEGSLGASRYLSLQREHTEVYEDKLVRALGYVPGVNVAVNVIVDHRETVKESRSFDEPRTGVTHEATRTLAQNTQPISGEPGVRPNTGASIAASGGRLTSLNDERAETSLEPRFGGTDSRTLDPGGHAVKVNASIGVPRGYFVRLFRDQAGDPEAAPTPEELDTLATVEIERMRRQLQPLVDTGPSGDRVEGTVAVSMIPDYALASTAGAGDAGLLGPGGLIDDSLVKYTGLGGLALVSLAMMFMMVRRAAGRSELPRDEELEGDVPPLPDVGAEIWGEADSAEMPMEGRELDEPTVRRHQMIEQINRMSVDAPDEAARIIRRWIQAEA